MSHRNQTREEHFAKTHRRVYAKAEMARRFEETQKRKAKAAVQKAMGMGLFSRFARWTKGASNSKAEEAEIKVPEGDKDA